MANIFKNLLNGLNLTEDDEDFDDEEQYNDRRSSRNYYDEEEDEEEQPRKKASRKRDPEPYEDSDDDYEQAKPAKQTKKSYGKVVHMKSIPGGGSMEVRVITPMMHEDSKEISDTLNSGIPVVLNLTKIANPDLAQRILDFTSGAVYAINGNLQEVTSHIYVVTPSTVPISGNFDEMLEGNIDLSGNTRYVFRD